MKFVTFQQNISYEYMGEDEIQNLLFNIVTSSVNYNIDSESKITKIEQFIATEDDAIELLIKII